MEITANMAQLPGPPPSKKRLLLLLYIDFILCSTIVDLIAYFITPEGVSYLWKGAIFVVLEIVLMAKFESFGKWILHIRSFKERDSISGKTHRRLFVDPNVKCRESFWTMLVGVLLVLDGLKGLIRWTLEFVPFPFFGFVLSENLYIAYEVLFGVLFIIAGIQILRLTKRGFVMGVILLTFNLAPPLFQPQDLRDYFIAKDAARRARYELPPRTEQAQEITQFIPVVVFAYFSLPLIALLTQRRRFGDEAPAQSP